MGTVLSVGWLRTAFEKQFGGIVIRVGVDGITKEIIFGNAGAGDLSMFQY
jgi:hypothetical protein